MFGNILGMLLQLARDWDRGRSPVVSSLVLAGYLRIYELQSQTLVPPI